MRPTPTPTPTSAVRAVLGELRPGELKTLARHHRLDPRGARRVLIGRIGEHLGDDVTRLLSADSPWLPLFWSDVLVTRFGARHCVSYPEMHAELRRCYQGGPARRVPAGLLRERVSRVRARSELRSWVAAVLEQPEDVVVECLKYDHANTTLATWLTYAEVYVEIVTGRDPTDRPWTESLAPLVSLCMGVALSDGDRPARAAVHAIRRRIQAWQELDDRTIRPLRELMHAGPAPDVVLAVARLLVRQPLVSANFVMNLLCDIAAASGRATAKQIGYIEEVASALDGGRDFFRPWQEFLQGARASCPGRDEYEAWMSEEEPSAAEPEAPGEGAHRERQRAPVGRPALGDCLELLGLTPPVGVREVRAAYRRLALTHHPDRHADDAERHSNSHDRMVRINVAYHQAVEILSRRH